jgi:uncharacterized protein (DUF3084 family)
MSEDIEVLGSKNEELESKMTDSSDENSHDPETAKFNHSSKRSSSTSSPQQIAKLVQFSQKQSSELESISESIKNLQSSVDQLKEQIETMEKANEPIIEWINRKIAKRERKRKAKADASRKKTKR